MSLPRSDFFKCPPLSDEQKARLIRQAQLSCQETVQNAMMMDANPVDHVIANPQTNRQAWIRKGVDSVDSLLEGMCCFTQVTGTLDEVSSFFHLNSHRQKQTFARVLGKSVLDKRILYHLVDRPNKADSENPLHSISIEWAALQPPLGFALRDLCYLECQDEFTFYDESTKKSRKGWIRSLHSVELPSCPSLWKSHRIRRTAIHRSGHVFLESEKPGELDYYHVLILSPQYRMPKVIAQLMVKEHLHQAIRLEEHFMMQRLNQTKVLRVISNETQRIAPSCELCEVSFGLFATRKQCCSSCQLVVCKACVQFWCFGQLDDKIPLCLLCSDQLRRSPALPSVQNLSISQETPPASANKSIQMPPPPPPNCAPSVPDGTFLFMSSRNSLQHCKRYSLSIFPDTYPDDYPVAIPDKPVLAPNSSFSYSLALSNSTKSLGAAQERSFRGYEECLVRVSEEEMNVEEVVDDVVAFMKKYLKQ